MIERQRRGLKATYKRQVEDMVVNTERLNDDNSGVNSQHNKDEYHNSQCLHHTNGPRPTAYPLL